jgi:hypothetical protein
MKTHYFFSYLLSFLFRQKLFQRTVSVWFCAVLVAFSFQPSWAAGGGMKTLNGHVPAATRSSVSIGSLPESNRLDLAIGVRARDPNGLKSFLDQLYDPKSPGYKRYLTTKQYTDRFGATQSDYDAVIRFATRNGLKVTKVHPNRTVLSVNGSVADIERAFHVVIRVYRHPTEPRTFYSPDVEPSVEATLPIVDVAGLENYSRGRSNAKQQTHPTGAEIPPTGSGPAGSYIGGDFRAAYAGGVSATGAGQAVGLLQLDGFYPNDIATYEAQAGLPNVPLTVVPVDGGVSVPGDGNLEVALDIEMSIAMAPGLSRVYVYEAPNNSAANIVDVVSQMANDNAAKNLSTSWFTAPGFTSQTGEQLIQQMAAQGQTFFCASGDDDAFPGQVPFPAESPFVIQVGGTFLTTNGAGGSWASEKVWNSRTPRDSGTYLGSSGGISLNFPIPSYQQGIDMSQNQGSTTNRNIPDVTMVGYGVYVVHSNGQTSNGILGTSIAAPLWAGFSALINQQAAGSGQPPVGFINPAIYELGKGPNFNAVFHDTTTGDNTWPSSPSRFFATPGYDLCAGWGSPQGAAFISALIAPNTPSLPTVLTDAASSVGTTSAVLTGIIFSNGSSPVDAHHIRIWTDPNSPFDIDDSFISVSGNSFSAQISGLTTNTMYSYQAFAHNNSPTDIGFGPGWGDGAVVTFTATANPLPIRLANISTRLPVQTGNSVLIGGFILSGSGSETIALRAIGPSLTDFGVAGALADPTLELRNSAGAVLMSNDDWQQGPSAGQLTSLGLAPTNAKESGIVTSLQAGAYTAVVSGKNGTTGVGLVELYDPDSAGNAQLANISTRGFVQAGNNVMIGGLILRGNNYTHVAVRGVGPSLAQFGISPALADPTLELHDGNGTVVISNDNWQSDAATASQLTALGLALSDPSEAGIYTLLPSGSFTAVLAGKNGGTGIGLIELYNVP